MADYSQRREAGIDDVTAVPKYTATGERSIRARSVSKRHIKILDDLQTELGDGAGRREAIAALAEFYHSNPEKVIEEVTGPRFR